MIHVALALLVGRLRPVLRASAPAAESLVDRVVAVDGMLVCGAAVVVTRAIDTGDGSFLPVTVVFTLVGFISTSVVARFVEGQGG